MTSVNEVLHGFGIVNIKYQVVLRKVFYRKMWLKKALLHDVFSDPLYSCTSDDCLTCFYNWMLLNRERIIVLGSMFLVNGCRMPFMSACINVFTIVINEDELTLLSHSTGTVWAYSSLSTVGRSQPAEYKPWDMTITRTVHVWTFIVYEHYIQVSLTAKQLQAPFSYLDTKFNVRSHDQ